MDLFTLFFALAVFGSCDTRLTAEERYTGDPSVAVTGSVNDTNHDISRQFCRIYRHASVVADGKVYIDGGNAYVPINNVTFNTSSTGGYSLGMNDQLVVLDLSKNFTTTDTFPYRSIQKGPDVPNGMIETSLLYSAATRKVTQIGGWFSYNSQTDPGYVPDNEIPTPAIWEFGVDSETWNQATGRGYPGYGEKKVERPGAAAYCDASTLNKSFIFGGHVWRRSDPDYSTYVLGQDMKFLEGMLVLDTSSGPTTRSLTNISVPRSLDEGAHPFGPRMNGAMVHVPIGDQGVLVFVGGQTTQNPTEYGVQIPQAAQGNVMLDLTFVDVYDLESGFWFRQQTFGAPDIPSARTDICIDLITAEDGSSYNVLMVAGMSSYKSYLATEEIWALSLPTFQWILVHTRPGGRYGHTCHIVGQNLLLIGGMQTQTDGQDVQTCSETMPTEVFDLNAQTYTNVYDASGASRAAFVPSQVVSVIGGSPTGGAQSKAPKVWSDVYLQYVFDPSLGRPSYTPTYTLANETIANSTNSSSTNGDSRPSTATVIGAAVGGAFGAILLIAAVVALLICIKRRRRQRRASEKEKQAKMEAISTLLEDDRRKKGSGETKSALQTQPAELGPNARPLVELNSNSDPIELFAPPTWNEVPASPISSVGRGVRSEPSLAFSQHRSLSVRTA